MRAKRSLGQNFLVDPNLQRKIVDALELEAEDTVIEIGPGHGALTQHLVERASRVVAVELDDGLADTLATRFADRPTLEVVHADALTWDPHTVLRSAPAKVVGNIPYNITSPLIFRVLEWRPPPERFILMIQKEVADRLVAPAGEKAYGALTVGVRAVADVRREFNVGQQAFRPVPDVVSTVVRINPVRTLESALADALRTLTRVTFSMRRKQIQKILRTTPAYDLDAETLGDVLAEVGVRPEDRPEDVAPETFVALAAALARRGYPRASTT